MNKKFSLGVTISLIAIACAITFVVTITVSTNMFNERIGGVTEREEIYSKLQEIDTYARSLSIFPINEEKLVSDIVGGYIDGLDDANARYLTAEEYYREQQIANGVITGTGIDAAREESGYIVVTSIYSGSPASTLDVQAGDIITAVDGVNVLELGAERAISALDGADNSDVTLVLQRSGENVGVTITRQSFTVQSVSSVIVDGYGYIRISALNAQTASQFTSAIDMFQAQGALGYVIDVRGCTGTISSLREILGVFISQQIIANAEYADGSISKLLETGETTPLAVHTVVLVDENTRGAGELFAYSMHEFYGSNLIGKTTAGNEYLTEKRVLSDSTAIELTIARILPLGSGSIDNGLIPDYAVESGGIIDAAPSQTSGLADAQLNKAFEVLASLKN